MPVGDLAPELAVLLTAVAALLAAMALPQRRQGLCAGLALAGLAVAAAVAAAQAGRTGLTFSGTFALDRMTDAARLTILAATALCVLLSPRWFAGDRRHGEVYAMLLFSCLGALAIAGAADLMQLVMGVLLSSITGYVLAAWHRDWPISLEAGMKYFLFGALANALMVVGVVILLGMTGATGLAEVGRADPRAPLSLAALALVLAGLLFKLGAVPGHPWVPDVAEGAPAPVAAFLTVVPKVAAGVALFRVAEALPAGGATGLLVAILAAVSMTLGNLAALRQEDFRRMIGWSSVSQAGYALVAVAVAGRAEGAQGALLLFLAAYAAGNVAALGAVAWLRGRTARGDFAGLARHRPLTAAALILSLLSLTGIPPLAGFAGKLALFTEAVRGGMAWLALVGIANSVLSLAVYLRFAAPMAFGTPGPPPQVLGGTAGLSVALAVAALAGLALAAGTFL